MIDILGKLNMSAIPIHEPPAIIAGAGMIFGGMGLVFLLTYLKRWKWLWKEWLTSVDHKKIGVMYIIVAIVMLLRGFADALMMRSQLALASGGGEGYLP